jgi:hypothetical protein
MAGGGLRSPEGQHMSPGPAWRAGETRERGGVANGVHFPLGVAVRGLRARCSCFLITLSQTSLVR